MESSDVHQFRSTLDAELKRLNTTGNYIEKRQAQPITASDEIIFHGNHIIYHGIQITYYVNIIKLCSHVTN